jgi:hypothetical protein
MLLTPSQIAAYKLVLSTRSKLPLGELPEVDLFTSDERILDFLSRYNRRFAQFDLTPLIEPLLI